jgi:hypothetical protein
MGENHFARVPTALYGVVLLMTCAIAWIPLQRSPDRGNGGAALAAGAAVSAPTGKGKLRRSAYASPLLAFFSPWICRTFSLCHW